MKIDLHVHSRYSTRPSQWVLQKIGCSESYTDPVWIYNHLKSKGMTAVTITDHNTIRGSLEIARFPDAFISEEITTYFPEDRCKVHVLAYNITESQHEEIQQVRENIYELVSYLNSEKIVHVVAHPLYGVNDRLTVDHFEKLLLMFKNFELNGARNDEQNQLLQLLVSNLTEKDIGLMSDRHNLVPVPPEPWIKNLTGGSDDHSGLTIARTYTEIPGADNVEGIMRGIENGDTIVHGEPSTPHTLARTIYSIAFQFYRNKLNMDRYVNKDVLLKFLESSLAPYSKDDGGIVSRLYMYFNNRKKRKVETEVPESLVNILRSETEKFVRENPHILQIPKDPGKGEVNQEERLYYFVNQVSSKTMSGFADHLMDHALKTQLFNIFHTIGSAGGLYFVLAPYFIGYSQFAKDRDFNIKLRERFNMNDDKNGDSIRIAHFTDTYFEVNGVARTLQQMVHLATKSKKDFTVITCDADIKKEKEGIKCFRPVGVYELPPYPEMKIFYPPFLEMLNYCYENNFTQIHSSTPGPIGLAALAISNILKLPINGVYHTALPQYAQYLTEDNSITELTWRYTLWYYNQMDHIYVTSHNTKDELIEKGIPKEKIKIFPRGIDIDLFHPSKKNGKLSDKYKIKEPVKLLYVGRVSREKNMPLLAESFKKIAEKDKNVHLVIVGDGPYFGEMKESLKGFPCTFTGYLKGEELASVYASCDAFVFPSTTDTFGNVVLEAQASGIPVIVSDQGGPCENLISEETGMIVKSDDVGAWVGAMANLAGNREIRTRMGKSARKYMESRSFENAFKQTWDLYLDIPETVSSVYRKAV